MSKSFHAYPDGYVIVSSAAVACGLAFLAAAVVEGYTGRCAPFDLDCGCEAFDILHCYVVLPCCSCSPFDVGA